MSIEIRNVNKTFGNFTALDNINITVPTGKMTTLLGPWLWQNDIVTYHCRLEYSDSGQILFDELDVTHTPVQKRHIGFMFQHYALFRHKNIADNIAFGLTLLPKNERPSKADINKRVAELLDLVQLPQLANAYPHQLSGGQRQRIALARALAVKPKLLLLDEPFGALDAKVRKELRTWLKDIHHELGITSIMVTHDQEEARAVSDEIVVMNHGHVEQVGTSEELIHHPANAFVSDFLDLV